MFLPIVIDQNCGNERSYDIYSRLLEDRIIFLSGEITSELANSIIAQMLFLEGKDSKKDICLYINSPGGLVDAGLAIFDTMNYIKCDVCTICVGMAASMSAILLASGTKGKRFSLPSSRIMIHQPLGGAQGQASDIKILAEEILKTKDKINKILSQVTGKTPKQIETDTNRDYYLSSKEAKEYGLIDKVITKRD